MPTRHCHCDMAALSCYRNLLHANQLRRMIAADLRSAQALPL